MIDQKKTSHQTPVSEVPRRPGFFLRSSRLHAFTLVELMISIALVVVLIVGINAVFKYTTTAVSMGQVHSSLTRDAAALQNTLTQDLTAFVANGPNSTDAPCTIINCTSVPIFRNHQDELAFTPNPANAAIPRELQIDLNNNGVVGEAGVLGELISPVTYNLRNSRTDTLSFFASGSFARQTGDPSFVDNMSSQEAWIWYGHLWLPNNVQPMTPAASWRNTNPGNDSTLAGQGGSVSVNPNNYYGSQLMLGRMAMLLRPLAPNTLGVYGIYDNQGVPQTYINAASPFSAHWSSLDFNSPSSVGTYTIQQSRYDVANGTISQFHTNLVNWINAGNGAWALGLLYNFQANPFLTKPLTSAQMAQASPILLTGCSQFMVEFAGDFVTQNNDPNDANNTGPLKGTAAAPDPSDGTYGDVLSNTGDGVIDFIIDKSASTTNPALWRRQIRWYGLPRDTAGTGIIRAPGAKYPGNNNLLNVVPVRDVVRTCVYGGAYTTFAGFSWENLSTNPAILPTPTSGNYADTTGGGVSLTGPAPVYTVYFGPKDPRIKMIRITITLDDPNGRLNDGQTYQYVYTLP